jgi:hypothetical protein
MEAVKARKGEKDAFGQQQYDAVSSSKYRGLAI